MERNWKIIVPRVAGDDVLTEQCVMHGVKHLGIDARVFSCCDDVGMSNTIHNKYVRGVDFLKNELREEDIVVFCHNDVNFIDTLFRNKVESIFNNTDVALLGVIGTSNLNEDGCWWNNPTNILRGHIIQGSKDKPVGAGFHMVKGLIGFFDDVVAIDGLCMITIGKHIMRHNINFDGTTYSGNHFYDLDFCMNFLTKGLKIGIADILVYHRSEGASTQNESWSSDKDKFVAKWKSKGIEFPITANGISEWIKKNNITIPDDKQSDIIEIEI